jgi:hypothetical protein
MCTYSISVDDELMERVSHNKRLSQRLRGIAHAPKDFDYKEELAKRF